MLIRALALTAGLAVSALALLAWRVPESHGGVGTDVAFRATKPGELTLQPPGQFGSGRALRPGGPKAKAALVLTNAADLPLGVAVSARPGDGEASRELWLEVRVNGKRLARGPLSELAHPSRRKFFLTRRGSARLVATAWLPASARGNLRARLGTAQILFGGRAAWARP